MMRLHRRSAVTVFGLIPAVTLVFGCGSEGAGGRADNEPPVFVEPGPPVRDSMSAATLSGIDPDEIGLALPWTTGEMNRRPIPGRTPTIAVGGMELIEGDGFDRLILAFEADGMEFPGYHLSYIQGPPADCAASAEEVSFDSTGGAFLEVRLTGVIGHDESGRSTVGARTVRGASSNLLALHRTCDFEGTVSWVWALQSATPYRIMELNGPARLVVDVQHPVADPAG